MAFDMVRPTWTWALNGQQGEKFASPLWSPLGPHPSRQIDLRRIDLGECAATLYGLIP
jgi:hypothetical protein